jgi:predicted transcriptional regulator YdeE
VPCVPLRRQFIKNRADWKWHIIKYYSTSQDLPISFVIESLATQTVISFITPFAHKNTYLAATVPPDTLCFFAIYATRKDLDMEPQIQHISPVLISGITVRTMNRDELNPDTAKISGLWAQFFSNNIANKVAHRLPEGPIYGVYSSYESDASGSFDVTAGVAVSAADAGFSNVEIQGGKYLVFEAKGAMPDTVIQAWSSIWTYFETHPQVKRAFLTDFELYLGMDTVRVHIGVAA